MSGRFVIIGLLLLGTAMWAQDFTPKKETRPELSIPAKLPQAYQPEFVDSLGDPFIKREGDNQPFQMITRVQLDDGTATITLRQSSQGNRIHTVPSDTTQLIPLVTAIGDTLTATLAVKFMGDSALQINSTDTSDNRWVSVLVVGR